VTDYDSYLAKAQAAEQAKNWGWAAWYYQEALAVKPKDPTATEGRKRAMPLYNQQRAARFYADGQSAEKEKAVDDARFYYEMSVKLAPDQADYTAALARVKSTENLATAQKFYQDGMAAQQKGALFEARSDLGMAAKLAPDQADYAKALDQINQLFIQRITELTSTERKIDEYVGRISRAISKGDKKSADRALQEALGKYPQEPALELIQKMMALWEKGGEKNPPNRAVQLLENEADLYLSKGRPDLAKDSLQEALKAQPSNQSVKDKLAQLDQAAPVVSVENAQKAEMLYEKGLQCYLAGDLDGAIAAWEEALKANPDHMKARNNLVRAKVEKESKTP
jgi:tetratricopeptide (TPR) repeat protein